MILGIVTARLGSKRLPVKVLLPIGETTMVGHVFDVLNSSKVDMAILCTPDKFLTEGFVNGASVLWQGDRDITGELFAAAKTFPCDHIVRVTADCPFLTSDIIDKTITAHLLFGADYTYTHNDYLTSVTPEGVDVEVVSFSVLKKLHSAHRSREHLCISTKGLNVNRVDIIEEREVFSVNTLKEYIMAYKKLSSKEEV